MSDRNSASSQTAKSVPVRFTYDGGRPRAFTFVQLVFESKWIVAGTVTATEKGGALPITLAITRSFPSGLPQQIRIIDKPTTSEAKPPSFKVGEAVVLFLENLRQDDGELLGTGDVGKWPRRSEDWLFSSGHIRPWGEVQSIVERLLRIDAMKTHEERVNALLNELILEGTLGEIAAAQYAADHDRWRSVISVDPVELAAARWAVGARFLLTVGIHDRTADYAVLQLLASAPSSIAIPYLIKRLDDPDAAVRDTAFSSLQTIVLPYLQDTLGFISSAPARQREIAGRRWERWWDQHRSARLREEVPKMLADLSSPHVLRRSGADSSLRLLSGKGVDYNAEEPSEQRREAIGRWQTWWEDFSQRLD